jgi:hypothetical protein
MRVAATVLLALLPALAFATQASADAPVAPGDPQVLQVFRRYCVAHDGQAAPIRTGALGEGFEAVSDEFRNRTLRPFHFESGEVLVRWEGDQPAFVIIVGEVVLDGRHARLCIAMAAHSWSPSLDQPVRRWLGISPMPSNSTGHEDIVYVFEPGQSGRNRSMANMSSAQSESAIRQGRLRIVTVHYPDQGDDDAQLIYSVIAPISLGGT